MKITTVGIDLAKNVFSVQGVDEHGTVALRKSVRRGKLLELFAQIPAVWWACRRARERSIGRANYASLVTSRGSWRRNLSNRIGAVAKTIRMMQRRSAKP